MKFLCDRRISLLVNSSLLRKGRAVSYKGSPRSLSERLAHVRFVRFFATLGLIHTPCDLRYALREIFSLSRSGADRAWHKNLPWPSIRRGSPFPAPLKTSRWKVSTSQPTTTRSTPRMPIGLTSTMPRSYGSSTRSCSTPSDAARRTSISSRTSVRTGSGSDSTAC